MKPMGYFNHTFCYVTLGLLCGWYYFLLLLFPTLIYLSYEGSYIAISVLVIFFLLTVTPLKHEPVEWFMYSWLFKVWREYFDFSYDCDSCQHGRMKVAEKYMFFEFPHGIFPMGQVLSASLIDEFMPGQMITGTGADIIFMVPVMRQMMAWLGTMPAKRKNITKTFEKGYRCAVIPGGIAEMFLVSDKTEGLFLKKRFNTVKAAIEEGAHIVPTFFFGNSKILKLVGNESGPKSWISKMSRKFRTSIVLFYGRQGLPVPFRHPLRMVTGDIVRVKQNSNPSEAEIFEVMERVITSVKKCYDTKKPDWEDRPLVIT
jgi:hypothetical protein